MSKRFPPSLGLAWPLRWREMQRQGELLDMKGDAYVALKESGFDYVDFGAPVPVAPDEAFEELIGREMNACAGHGLGVSIHPNPAAGAAPTDGWFGDTPEAEALLECLWRILSLVSQTADAPVPAVFHAAMFAADPAAAQAQRRAYLQRSRLFFADLERRGQKDFPLVRPVVEHGFPFTADEGIAHIADTCEELLQVVADCDFGLCWDTGHYLMAVERRGQGLEPPDEFLRRVRHVHLHDVADGRDHRPITSASELPRRFMQILQGVGFTGSVTLEYDWALIPQVGGFAWVLKETPGILARWAV